MSGASNFMKFWVAIMSLAFMLVGTVVMALSVYLLTDNVEQNVAEAPNPNLQYLQYGKIFILVSGCLLLMGGIVGCCGGFRQSSGCLTLFFLIVLIIAVGQLAAGIFAYVRRDELISHFSDIMLQTFNQQHKTEQSPKHWDYIQEEWRCCGAKGYRDYQHIKAGTVDLTISSIHSPGYYNVPPSCCVNETPGKCDNLKFPVDGSIPSGTEIYMEGCSDKIVQAFFEHIHIVMYAMIALGCAELFCLIFSCGLICAFRNRRSNKY